MIDQNNVNVLMQFIYALNDACVHLEESYNRRDIESFEKSKKLILELKSKIDLIIR